MDPGQGYERNTDLGLHLLQRLCYQGEAKTTLLTLNTLGLMLGLCKESYGIGPGLRLLESGLGSYRIRAKVGDRAQLVFKG